MISGVLAVCAEKVIVDRFTNSVSVIDIFEQIKTEVFPVVVPRMFCFFELTRESNDPMQYQGLLTIRLGNTELMRGPHDVDFQGSLRVRTVLQLRGLVVPGPGTLRASFNVGDAVVGYWDVSCESRGGQIVLPLQSPQVEPPPMPTILPNPTHEP